MLICSQETSRLNSSEDVDFVLKTPHQEIELYLWRFSYQGAR
jgi:hypothetical protein